MCACAPRAQSHSHCAYTSHDKRVTRAWLHCWLTRVSVLLADMPTRRGPHQVATSKPKRQLTRRARFIQPRAPRLRSGKCLERRDPKRERTTIYCLYAIRYPEMNNNRFCGVACRPHLHLFCVKRDRERNVLICALSATLIVPVS